MYEDGEPTYTIYIYRPLIHVCHVKRGSISRRLLFEEETSEVVWRGSVEDDDLG